MTTPAQDDPDPPRTHPEPGAARESRPAPEPVDAREPSDAREPRPAREPADEHEPRDTHVPNEVDRALPGRSDSQGWRRLHKATPLLRGWQVVAIVLVFVWQQVLQWLPDRGQIPGWPDDTATTAFAVGGLAAVFVGAVVLWAVLAWRATRYRVTRDVLHLHSGVLFRQQRQVRLDRLQAIDVVQPLVARLFGLAELKLEVAGGSGSDARLAYLRLSEAEQVRAALLAHAAGVRYEGERAPEAPERALVALPLERLLESLARSTGACLFAAFVVVILVLGLLGYRWASLALFPTAVGAIGGVWVAVSGSYGFRVAASPDGLRVRRGLLDTRAQTVPPGRVQAVSLTQPLLWRGRDWWRLQVNVAGYAGDEAKDQSGLLMPVATRHEALVLLAQVFPDVYRPRMAHLMAAGLTGRSDGGRDRSGAGYLCAPRIAWLLDPIGWRRLGVAVDERALIIRSRRLTRQLVLVPHERTQSLAISRGPLQRRLGLADFRVHSTRGPVNPCAKHLRQGQAGALLAEQARRARVARAGSGPERWLETEPPH